MTRVQATENFRRLDITDDGDQSEEEDITSQITELESLCVNCHEQGKTILLPTSVPYFRKIVLISFRCEHCNFSNSEVQDFGELGEKGVRTSIRVESAEDLSRQVIKASHASIHIPELEFEIPSATQRGSISTVEGFLTKAADGLDEQQIVRKSMDPELATKIQSVIDTLRAMSSGNRSFTFILDDPTGNSYVQNPNAPRDDARATIERYTRTDEQTRACGFAVEDCKEEEEKQTKSSGPISVTKEALSKLGTFMDVTSNAATLIGICSSCQQENETRTCVVKVPNFKECVLMVSECTHCNYRDAEVKPGGGVSALGKRVILNVVSPDDLKRDLLKSDSAGISIPELDFEMVSGTLGGKYTTVEGILQNIYDQLASTMRFASGDSAVPDEKTKYEKFLKSFAEIQSCSRPYTLILDDPLGNAFIGHIDPLKTGPDPEVEVQEYTRTFEQNEELGINDMNTEDYDETSEKSTR
eukprot:86458_1